MHCKFWLFRPIAWLSVAALLGVSACRQGNEISEAGVYLNDALDAIKTGDNDRAIELLSKSLELETDPYAYLQRAKLYLELDEVASASADIAKGLELEPEHPDLLWLQEQAKKPTATRFKGEDAEPPSYAK
jgi:tetratricopeptide (TPR) repeat protein